jgi:hypothetical protein
MKHVFVIVLCIFMALSLGAVAYGAEIEQELMDAVAQRAADQRAAAAVVARIEAIGEVVKTSGDKIKAARTAYDGLTDSQKALVTNYEKLTRAETVYLTVAPTGDPTIVYIALFLCSAMGIVAMVSKRSAF